MRNSVALFTLLAGTILLPPASYADDSDARVARVSYVSGDVSYQRGDDDDNGWNGLRVNTPLVTGDAFFAPEGGRAEVDLGSGIVIRVDGGTEVELVNNTSEIAQLGLTSGVLDIRTRSFPDGFTVEIDTPTGAATILEPGRYRVEVTDRLATYSVVQGSMSLAVDGQQLDVREGESLQLEDTDPPTYGYGQLAGNTPFQSWADQRDSRWERSSSARYVNHDVVGYEDLDDHGTWRDNREYGRVWVPSGMSQGWAPYQSGRWIWQDPYGWTWVSDESWGWAPYHYGRWVRAGNDWGWVPPPPRGYRGPSVVMNIQPIYAPALVAFVGGRNWGVSLSIGGGSAIGWVPLAPRERYYYPWQQAPRVTNNYTNITVVNAVTVVNYNTFTTGAVRPIRVERAQIERAPVLGFTAVGVVPARASLTVSLGTNPAPRAIPRTRTERPLVARLVPPPRPQQFTQKVVEIQRTGLPVARPVAIEAAVGKPFVPGVRAPAGVKAFSAPSPGGRKELSARPGAEVRAPKRIERDIAPPIPAAARGRLPSSRTPAEVPSANAPVAPTVAPPPVRPEPVPERGARPVQPDPRPIGQPDARKDRVQPPAPAPAPTPPSQEAPRARGNDPVRPGQDVPSNRNSRRNMNTAPVPQPVPTPAPTPSPQETRTAPVPQPVAPPPESSETPPGRGNRDRRLQPAAPPARQPEVRKNPESAVGQATPPAAAPTPQAPPARGDRRMQPTRPPAQQPEVKKNPESAIGQATPAPAAAPTPQAPPARGDRRMQPAPPAAQKPEVKKNPESAVGQAQQPQPVPKNKKKAKDKNAPEPPPPDKQ